MTRSSPLSFRRGHAGLTAVGALLIACFAAAPIFPASRLPAWGANAMVVSPEPTATQVGLDVLRRGGNAVDACVAVAFALAVTDPAAGNLGGGGFLLYRTESLAYHALDFRETAPRHLRAELFLDENGKPIEGRSLDGGLAIGVPGSVAGLAEAHRLWGRLPWRELLRPAIKLAHIGPRVSARLARDFSASGKRLARNPEARAVFMPTGEFPHEGDRLVQTDLAHTLERIAKRGAAGFYDGVVADSVVRSVQAHGGVMDASDLGGYRTARHEPLIGSYRGHRIVTFPPPSSGGVALLQMLAMLEEFDPAENGFGASSTIHRMTEIERRAYADRSRWLGDPAFFDVPVAALLDAAYLHRRAMSIRRDRATPSEELDPGTPRRVSTNHDTLHFSVADASGRVVAMTTTLNTSFGTGIVAGGTGVLLNNEIDDFALAPGVPNFFGLVGGEANAVAAGKRPLSSMTPTIVELRQPGPRPALVLGSPGGGAIITSILQVLVNVIDHGMNLQEAVDAPRFHHQWLPDVIRVEPRAFPLDVSRNLRALGHRLETVEALGNVNAIGVDEQGRWLGAADPRRAGLASGY